MGPKMVVVVGWWSQFGGGRVKFGYNELYGATVSRGIGTTVNIYKPNNWVSICSLQSRSLYDCRFFFPNLGDAETIHDDPRMRFQ